MKEIRLSNGKVALVDDEDYDELARHKWQCNSRGYAQRTFMSNKKKYAIVMHRQILDAPAGLEVDHIDRNRLNNQRSNLRLATRGQNCQNIGDPHSRSGRRNVIWHGPAQKWAVRLWLNRKSYSFGLYADIEEATRVAAEARASLFTHADNHAATNAALGGR